MPEKKLSQREIKRYSRQIMIPEIGIRGQELLKRASVIVVGAGGLGCPVLMYLAAGGIGRLAVLDHDFVDERNLQRQLLYNSNDVGKLKTVIAKSRLEQLNPLISVESLNIRLEASNSLTVLKNYDIVVDATDNIKTRYLINDSCVILGKPMVHGAVYKFEGQVSVFNFMAGPTYRCYNPSENFKEQKDPPSDETGLISVLPGITGTIMANEVIKIITETGDVLAGKLLLFNILTNSFHLLNIRNIPENHLIKELQSYHK
jgi:adenylyltransferase/sulfurtransferase